MLQSMGSLESDTTERLHFHFLLSCIGEGNGNPLQCSCLENPGDGGAWWAAVCGVAQSRTRLKRLSSSSSSSSSVYMSVPISQFIPLVLFCFVFPTSPFGVSQLVQSKENARLSFLSNWIFHMGQLCKFYIKYKSGQQGTRCNVDLIQL